MKRFITLKTGERVELLHDFPRDGAGIARGLTQVRHADGRYSQIFPDDVRTLHVVGGLQHRSA